MRHEAKAEILAATQALIEAGVVSLDVMCQLGTSIVISASCRLRRGLLLTLEILIMSSAKLGVFCAEPDLSLPRPLTT